VETIGLGEGEGVGRLACAGTEVGEDGREGDMGGYGLEVREESLCFNAERSGIGLETECWYGVR